MTRKKVVILTTGGKLSGLGHLSRMISLRRELLLRGHDVFFVIHDTGGMPFFENSYHCSWHLLHGRLSDLTSGFDAAVVDSYYAEEECYRFLSSGVSIAIDDFERIKYPVHAVIRPSIKIWGDRTIQTTKVFEGPEYIVINEDAKKIYRNEHSGALLISAGGGCNDAVIDVFCKAALSSGFKKVFVVSGSSFREITRKNEFAKFVFFENLSFKDYAKVVSQCSFALIACGVSLSEMAYAAMPTVGVVIAEDQKSVGEGFCAAGFLGKVLNIDSREIVEEITNELKLLLNDPLLAKYRSELGRRIVPGTGAERMADVLESLMFQKERIKSGVGR